MVGSDEKKKMNDPEEQLNVCSDVLKNNGIEEELKCSLQLDD